MSHQPSILPEFLHLVARKASEFQTSLFALFIQINCAHPLIRVPDAKELLIAISTKPIHSPDFIVLLRAAPWYVYQTLLKSDRRVDEPEKADIIFVYDYCRLMWALSEEHAEHHWWASEYLKKKLTGTGGPALVSAYNVMTQVWGQHGFSSVRLCPKTDW